MSVITVELICPDCKKKFNLNAAEALEKITISCPDCQCYLPEDELKDFKIAVKHMLQVNQVH
ncbi:MAG: hypothetical protein LRZ99_00195 [Desulfotomaculum sp.]|nr:hypothetical protein [Desulfotomaculum sp.]